MIRSLFFCGLLVFVFSSCSCKTKSSGNELFDDLVKRHPDFAIPVDSTFASCYTLTRSVVRPASQLRLDIYLKEFKGQRYHIVFAERNGAKYAMPVYPFEKSEFWNFQNESGRWKAMQYTFEYEYNRLLEELALDTGRKLLRMPFWEIKENILFLDTYQDQDSTMLGDRCDFFDKDSTFYKNRNRKNRDDLNRLMHPEDYFTNCAGNVDFGGNYVLWAEEVKRMKGKYRLDFKAFSFKCSEQLPMYL